MLDYLVGYDSTGIYRIYHPKTKKIKVSRDVVFSEDVFFDVQWVSNSDEILSIDNDVDVPDSESESHFEQNEIPAALIIHDEIATADEPPVSPISFTPSIPPHDYEIRSTTESLKPPNRRQRQMIARAFKIILKGNMN